MLALLSCVGICKTIFRRRRRRRGYLLD